MLIASVGHFVTSNTLTRSAVTRMTTKRETKLSITNVEYNNILYSTPLQNTSVTDYAPFTVEHQFNDAVKKMKDMMGSKSDEDQLEELVIIDTIQRLGLEYYFKEEIHATLERHYAKCFSMRKGSCDLHEVALRFRLLRQEGYGVTSDTFSTFKDEKGKFKEALCKDIKGLMSLFEACQLSIRGDGILDEAREYCGQLLKSYLREVEQTEAEIIESTLRSPNGRVLPRLTGKTFLLDFKVYLKFLHGHEASDRWMITIQDVARKEFNMAQITHQSEITHVSRWWKQIHLTNELKLARNQPVKWYMWSLAALPSPNMGEERIELTKPISLIYIIDDIFDVYGTIEELTLFTEAVNRWEYADMRLPDYMKACLRALHDTTNEISQKIYVKHEQNPKESLQKAWADLCNAFLIEAKWFSSGHLPSTEEYLKNGIVSTGVHVVAIHLFYLLGQGLNSQSTVLPKSFTDIVTSTATILRLCDDLGSSKDEQQNGYDGSFIDYYLNENEGISAESAREKVRQMISDEWKSLNEKCLSPSSVSAQFRKGFLNMVRMVPTMYSYDNNQCLHDLERHMKLFLYEKVY